MEPFFSVVLSAIFLNEKPTLPVLLCLLPIVGGVVMASITEVITFLLPMVHSHWHGRRVLHGLDFYQPWDRI